MIFLDLIQISEDRTKFTYWYYLFDDLMVHEYIGHAGVFEKKFYQMQINILAEMYRKFVVEEAKINHDSKDLFLRNDNLDKIERFINYILTHESNYEEIKELSAGKMLRPLKHIYSLIPDSEERKKNLLFIIHSVTLNANHRIKVYKTIE